MSQKTIMITGAAGNIGRKLCKHLKNRYTLKLLDINGDNDSEINIVDLSNWQEDLVGQFENVDAVVHLAADPDDTKTWEELIPSNLDVLNNVFVASMKAKVPRVIYASSNHVMGGYSTAHREGRWLNTALEHKPGTIYEDPSGTKCDSTAYGAMKLFGERLGRCYALSTNSVCIAIRIGWVLRSGQNLSTDLPSGASEWFKRMWLSTTDLCNLMEQAITVPKPPGTFLTVNGMSDNSGMVWNIDDTRALLGYAPVEGLKST